MFITVTPSIYLFISVCPSILIHFIPFLSLHLYLHTHTHTHTYIYIYIYIYGEKKVLTINMNRLKQK